MKCAWLDVCQAGLFAQRCRVWQGRELWRLPSAISAFGAAFRGSLSCKSGDYSEVREELVISLETYGGLWSCPSAQSLCQSPPLSAPSANDLSGYEGHTLSSPDQKSRAVPHHSTLARSKASPTTALSSPSSHHLISHHNHQRLSAAANRPVHNSYT